MTKRTEAKWLLVRTGNPARTVRVARAALRARPATGAAKAHRAVHVLPVEAEVEAEEVRAEAHRPVPLEVDLQAARQADQQVPLEVGPRVALEVDLRVALEVDLQAARQADQQVPLEVDLQAARQADQQVPLEVDLQVARVHPPQRHFPEVLVRNRRAQAPATTQIKAVDSGKAAVVATAVLLDFKHRTHQPARLSMSEPRTHHSMRDRAAVRAAATGRDKAATTKARFATRSSPRNQVGCSVTFPHSDQTKMQNSVANRSR
jgi:hypothetical protein